MTSSPQTKELRLQDLVRKFCESDLAWQPIQLGEKEPEYTRRVLFPQFEEFVLELNDKQLSLASDGSSSRPNPVAVGHGQTFYPDISISLFGERTIAFEVKYLGEQSYSGRLATAVGQAVVYATCGYRYAHALLVAESGSKALVAEDRVRLNAGLKHLGVTLHFLGS